MQAGDQVIYKGKQGTVIKTYSFSTELYRVMFSDCTTLDLRADVLEPV